MGMFKLNFTEDDKTSEANTKGFEPIPSGVYAAFVTDVELKEVVSGPNKGKPFLKVEFTIQDEAYANRKLWANVMLFDLPNGNWFIAQFLKATGFGDALDTGDIPSGDQYEGKEVSISVVRKIDKWKNDKEGKQPDGKSWYKNEINGFVTDGEVVATPKGRTKRNSMLP